MVPLFFLVHLILWLVLGAFATELQVRLSSKKSYLLGLILPVLFACCSVFYLGVIRDNRVVGALALSICAPVFILVIILLLVHAYVRRKKREAR